MRRVASLRVTEASKLRDLKPARPLEFGAQGRVLHRGMHENILVAASRLSNEELLARLKALAGRERSASVELVAHLAALDARPSVHLGKGKSLYLYCTQVLHLSEHAAYNRIGAARAARKFPVILDLLADGSVNVTTVTLLSPHLTPENHGEILKEATHRTKDEVKAIVSRLDPQPDAPTVVRRLPAATPRSASPPMAPVAAPTPGETRSAPPLVLSRPPLAAVVAPLAPDRYRVQVTVGKETHDKLRRLQDLLAREVPGGDPAAIIDRALTLLLKEVEKKKLGAAAKPRSPRLLKPGSRHVPAHVRRAVQRRDRGRCAFVSEGGVRCAEARYLEYHHVVAFAKGGPATVDNIALRCRAHNVYEAELVFGRFDPPVVREPAPAWGAPPTRSRPSTKGNTARTTLPGRLPIDAPPATA
jgi:hypothetical protein